METTKNLIKNERHVVMNQDQYPDKYTWGKADSRKEIRFNCSNLEESKTRLANFMKIIEPIENVEVKNSDSN